MKKGKNNLTSFSDHLDSQYGKRGLASREKYEQEFEAFKLGVFLQELRKEKGMTQEELAEKCGTSKTYISRIENNASEKVNGKQRPKTTPDERKKITLLKRPESKQQAPKPPDEEIQIEKPVALEMGEFKFNISDILAKMDSVS